MDGDLPNIISLFTNEAGAKRLSSIWALSNMICSRVTSINDHSLFHQPKSFHQRYYCVNAIIATILASFSLVRIVAAKDELSPSKEARERDGLGHLELEAYEPLGAGPKQARATKRG